MFRPSLISILAIFALLAEVGHPSSPFVRMEPYSAGTYASQGTKKLPTQMSKNVAMNGEEGELDPEPNTPPEEEPDEGLQQCSYVSAVPVSQIEIFPLVDPRLFSYASRDDVPTDGALRSVYHPPDF